MYKKFFKVSFLILIVSLTSCVLPASLTPDPPALSTIYTIVQQTLTPEPSYQPETTGEIQDPDADNSQDNPPLVFIQPGIPTNFYANVGLDQYQITNEQDLADVKILLSAEIPSPVTAFHANWVYAVAAPFYTLQDDITLDNLKSLIHGETVSGFEDYELIMTSETALTMANLFGTVDETAIQIIEQDQLQETALSNQHLLAVMPFEDLTPHWKVLRINSLSPIEDGFNPVSYPLTAHIFLDTELTNLDFTFPEGNYDGEKRTVLVMTGVTALTRATAFKMETNSITYPGKDIRDWLVNADLTHISNEIPFAENCPYPDPNQPDLVFCSNVEYIGLLENIGADIIELSGNHILDYGVSAANLTLEMYQSENWLTFAGGWDIAEAQSPALITHNGNNLAFLGCNLVGPAQDWATNSQPGSAPCGDFVWMKEEIADLKSEGYLPIVSIQYAEDYTAYPSAKMEQDFSALAQAGAVVVNGSQAHTPKIMVFKGDTFIHYGLGNLFFDQMAVYYNNTLMPGTRDEFIDRLVFYDGELISIELLTAKLEDYARPRPMTAEERSALLSRIFEYAPIQGQD